jgi:hypothetical protein
MMVFGFGIDLLVIGVALLIISYLPLCYTWAILLGPICIIVGLIVISCATPTITPGE